MEALERKLNYTFHSRALLEEALNHSSYANEHRGSGVSSNERLEFLGDSILGFVTAEYLFKTHPDLPEGDLTRMRAALVCEQSLYEVARHLELGQYLKLGRGENAGGGRTRPAAPGPRCTTGTRTPRWRRCRWAPGSIPSGPPVFCGRSRRGPCCRGTYPH